MAIPSIVDLVDVVPTGTDAFESRTNPERMGNPDHSIAYGGCALAFGLRCAYATVGPQYHVYTLMGNFLGPVSTQLKITARVARVRDTRTFATRRVEVFQRQKDGKDRLVMYQLADFQVREKASLMTFSAPPLRPRPALEQSLTGAERAEIIKQRYPGSADIFQAHDDMFAMFLTLMDWRLSPDGVFAQNVMGMVKDAKTTQDHLPLTDRVSGDWLKTKEQLTGGVAQNAAVLALLMDNALAFIPLAHSGQYMDVAGACSSLDFSLRVFSNDLALDRWHYRELRTIAGAEGRTFTESRLWDGDGRMVAQMTQQSILRPRPDAVKL